MPDFCLLFPPGCGGSRCMSSASEQKELFETTYVRYCTVPCYRYVRTVRYNRQNLLRHTPGAVRTYLLTYKRLVRNSARRIKNDARVAPAIPQRPTALLCRSSLHRTYVRYYGRYRYKAEWRSSLWDFLGLVYYTVRTVRSTGTGAVVRYQHLPVRYVLISRRIRIRLIIIKTRDNQSPPPGKQMTHQIIIITRSHFNITQLLDIFRT